MHSHIVSVGQQVYHAVPIEFHHKVSNAIFITVPDGIRPRLCRDAPFKTERSNTNVRDIISCGKLDIDGHPIAVALFVERIRVKIYGGGYSRVSSSSYENLFGGQSPNRLFETFELQPRLSKALVCRPLDGNFNQMGGIKGLFGFHNLKPSFNGLLNVGKSLLMSFPLR
jgi:hypothetical protein